MIARFTAARPATSWPGGTMAMHNTCRQPPWPWRVRRGAGLAGTGHGPRPSAWPRAARGGRRRDARGWCGYRGFVFAGARDRRNGRP